ncbi:50S ribosomal protein L9 [Lyticum sinuosum]|uniref:Large ribosomal subunit protein bL9 n=1 Tax=Lyticum sinuosum TaxID=1332059 RepID=A0AAE5AH23_9RICK|nr:50S ribosomal protein L9 [Lyticum sinuosum]MDZ5761085.1 50S ribosomal protein L9 [Lyticum sinuosum]
MGLLKVILLKNMNRIGSIGDTVQVRRGYANYLIRIGYAIRETLENIEFFKEKKALIEKTENEARALAHSIKDEINEKVIEMNVHADDNGNLYGSVTSKDIIEKCKELFNIDIKTGKFLNINRIKHIGDFKIQIELYIGIIAEIYLFLRNADKKYY